MPPIIKTPVRPAFSVTAALVEQAALVHGIEAWQLLRRNRERKYSHVRFGVIWVLRKLSLACTTIRDQLGFDDHTSVLYGQKWAEDRRSCDPDYKRWTDDLLAFALSLEPVVRSEAA